MKVQLKVQLTEYKLKIQESVNTTLPLSIRRDNIFLSIRRPAALLWMSWFHLGRQLRQDEHGRARWAHMHTAQ